MPTVSREHPFPGLRPFGFDDAAYFFGRDEQIHELRRKLERSRFIAVVGRSGDGKSSIVKAGLVPRLAAEAGAEETSTWLYDEMRPQGAPLEGLARVVDRLRIGLDARAGSFPEDMRLGRIRSRLSRSSRGLVELLGESLGERRNPVLIVVDQFEELFRFERGDVAGEDFEAAAAFVALLLQASRSVSPVIHVVLTMRSDFLGDCPRFRELPEAINDSQFLVPRLTRNERREVVEKPIEQAGATIEPALVQRLLNDAGDTPDMLPVLQHTLMRSWEAASVRWADGAARSVRLEDYVRVGGVDRALARHADEVVATLGAAGACIEPIVKALVDTDDEGRVIRRTPAPRLSDLIELCAADERLVRATVDALRDDGCCFVRPIRSETESLRDDTPVDVSHEALIRRWDRVEHWREEEHRDGRIWMGLIDAVGTGDRFLTGAVAVERLGWWEQRRPSAKWAERYGARFDEVGQLIEASRKHLRWERVRSAAPWVAVAFLVLSVAGLFFGYSQSALREFADEQRLVAEEARMDAVGAREKAEAAKSEAEHQRELATSRLESWKEALAGQERAKRTADRAQARALAARAEEQIAQDQPVVGLRLATAILSGASGFPSDLPEAQNAAYAALAKLAHTTVQGHGDRVLSVAFSPDGMTLASGSEDNTVRLWDVATGEALRTFAGHGGPVSSVAFSPDGARVASGSFDNTVRLWDVATGEPLRTFAGHDDDVNSVAFSPDGARVASGSDDNTVRLWDVATGGVLAAFTHHSHSVRNVAFSPDGQTLASGSWDNTVRLWDVASGLVLNTFEGHGGDVNSVAFSPDGKTLASGSADNTVRLWDVASGGELTTFEGHRGGVSSVAFSPDGQRLASGSSDNTVRLWDVASGEVLTTFEGHGDDVYSVAFSPDGAALASGSSDGIVRIRSLVPLPPVRVVAADATLEEPWLERLRAMAAPERSGKQAAYDQPRPWERREGAPLTAEVTQTRGGERVQVVDRGTGTTLAEVPIAMDAGAVLDVAFSSNGRRSLTTTSRGRMAMWEIPDAGEGEERPQIGSPIARFGGPEDVFVAAAFDPDGTRVAGLLGDGRIKLWPVFASRDALVEFVESLPIPELTDGQRCSFGLLSELECLEAAPG